MRIIVLGGGAVGTMVARRLARERNEVVIVEQRLDRCELLDESLDAKIVQGNASSIRTLEQAGIREAEMLIAVTSSDEANILGCLIAQRHSNVKIKVARLRTHEVYRWKEIFDSSRLNVDLVINPDQETAERILRVIGLPGISDVLEFAEGRVRLFGMNIEQDSWVVGKSMAELDRSSPPKNSLMAIIFRGRQTFIPRGGDRLQAGDHVYIVAPAAETESVFRFMGVPLPKKVERVFIVGGRQLGVEAALRLERQGVQVKLFEKDLVGPGGGHVADRCFSGGPPILFFSPFSQSRRFGFRVRLRFLHDGGHGPGGRGGPSGQPAALALVDPLAGRDGHHPAGDRHSSPDRGRRPGTLPGRVLGSPFGTAEAPNRGDRGGSVEDLHRVHAGQLRGSEIGWNGMGKFDALCHAFSTMATGGFSTRNGSIEAFGNPVLEIVIVVFMVLAGINFTRHYRLLVERRVSSFWGDVELRLYLIVIGVMTAAMSATLLQASEYSLGESLRLASFQVVSIMTTTGFSSADFQAWSPFAQLLLLVLMFVGGCTGSTAGGMKVARIGVLFRVVGREFRQLVEPRGVFAVRFGGRAILEKTIRSLLNLVYLAFLVNFVACMCLAGLGMDVLTTISAVAACMFNIGPGLGQVGPDENYAGLPAAAKWVLSICMLAGRLEFYTLLVLFTRPFWRM